MVFLELFEAPTYSKRLIMQLTRTIKATKAIEIEMMELKNSIQALCEDKASQGCNALKASYLDLSQVLHVLSRQLEDLKDSNG